MPDTLSRALRDVVDASADPVTVEEILGLPLAPSRSRRAWPLLAAAAVVLLAVVGGLVGQGGEDDTDRQVTASTPTVAQEVELPPIEACTRVVGDPTPVGAGGPCTVTDGQAEAMLGFPIAAPSGIPESWRLTFHEIRRWVNDEGEPVSPPDYNRAWFEPESCTLQRPAPDDCLDHYVQITVREAADGEGSGAVVPARLPDFNLSDGTDVYGIGTSTTATLDWVADGRSYRLRSQGVGIEQALTIADSLA